MKTRKIISILLVIACVFALASCQRKEGEPSRGLALSLNESGDAYTVTGIGKCKDSDVLIPEEYKGLPVTAIGEYAFNVSGVTKITLTENIVYIAENAFDRCYSLNYNIYEGIRYLGTQTNPHYAIISVKENSEDTFSIHENAKVLADCALYDCDVSSVSLPSGVTHVGGGAFYSCGKLESVSIPETVVFIGDEAFGNCGDLEEIALPKSLAHLGESAFMYCAKLTTIRFGGTKAQWDAMADEDWNEYFGEHTLVFSGGE